MSYSWSAAITTEPCFNSHTNSVFFKTMNGFENILHYIAIARTKRGLHFFMRDSISLILSDFICHW